MYNLRIYLQIYIIFLASYMLALWRAKTCPATWYVSFFKVLVAVCCHHVSSATPCDDSVSFVFIR